MEEAGEATEEATSSATATATGVMATATATAGAIITRIYAVIEPLGPSRFGAAGAVLRRASPGSREANIHAPFKGDEGALRFRSDQLHYGQSAILSEMTTSSSPLMCPPTLATDCYWVMMRRSQEDQEGLLRAGSRPSSKDCSPPVRVTCGTCADRWRGLNFALQNIPVAQSRAIPHAGRAWPLVRTSLKANFCLAPFPLAVEGAKGPRQAFAQ
jgi:hypothetical protein